MSCGRIEPATDSATAISQSLTAALTRRKKMSPFDKSGVKLAFNKSSLFICISNFFSKCIIYLNSNIGKIATINFIIQHFFRRHFKKLIQAFIIQ